MNKLEVELLGHKLKNPLIMASGTYGYGRDFENFYNPSILGGISSKGLTLNPKEGNRGVRIHECESAIMNSIGLENPGVEYFAKNVLHEMQELGTMVMINLGGNSLDDYLKGAEILNDYEVDMIELNISCPNVKEGGMAFGMTCESSALVTKKIREVSKHKIVVKLSPNAENIVEIAKSCEEEGAHGLSLVNTFQAMAIDIDKRKPVFDNVYAGLSGPAIKPIALRMVHQVCKAVEIPVIGLGGISNYRDVLEFIMAGATAVQIGTGNFVDPELPLKIIEDLERYMDINNINSLEEIRGIV